MVIGLKLRETVRTVRAINKIFAGKTSFGLEAPNQREST